MACVERSPDAEALGQEAAGPRTTSGRCEARIEVADASISTGSSDASESNGLEEERRSR